MSETEATYSGTGANPEAGLAPQVVPYAEQQIRALCLVVAATTARRLCGKVYLELAAVQWRKFIAEGNWDG